MTKKATQLSGAQQERDSTVAYIRRKWRKYDIQTDSWELCNEIVIWLLKRNERFNAKPGGLGKKPKRVKSDFDALGIP